MNPRRNSSLILEETVNNLRRLVQVMNKQSKNVVLETGLTGPQLWAIKIISGEPGNSIMVSRLANRMFLNSSTVVRILDVLEAKGLVQRLRSMNDRRIVHVSLTDQGSAILSKTPDLVNSLLINNLKYLSENKLNNISISLSLLLNILQSEGVPEQISSPEKV